MPIFQKVGDLEELFSLVYKSTILEHLKKCARCKLLTEQAFATLTTHAPRFGKPYGSELTEEECKVVFSHCQGCKTAYDSVMQQILAHLAQMGVFLN